MRAGTIVVAIATTALFAWLDFLAAFLVFDWAGGSFGGYGESGRSPAAWAIPTWVLLTAALVTLDVVIVRSVVRRTRVM